MQELISLLEETDPELGDLWIWDLSLTTNTCFSEISGYLKERENDTLSSLNSGTTKRQVESWVLDTLLQISKSDGALSPDQEESFHGTGPTTETIPKEKRTPPTTDIDQDQGEFYRNLIAGKSTRIERRHLRSLSEHPWQGNGETTEKATEALGENLFTTF